MQFKDYIIDTLRHSSLFQILSVCSSYELLFVFQYKRNWWRKRKDAIGIMCICSSLGLCSLIHLHTVLLCTPPSAPLLPYFFFSTLFLNYSLFIHLVIFHDSLLTLSIHSPLSPLPLFFTLLSLQLRSWGHCSKRKMTYNAKLSGWWFTFN